MTKAKAQAKAQNDDTDILDTGKVLEGLDEGMGASRLSLKVDCQARTA